MPKKKSHLTLQFSDMQPKIEDVHYRMLKSGEVGRAMAFEDTYIVKGNERDKLSKTFSMLQPQSWDGESVWTGINYMLGLNAAQRAKKSENNICPLPFDIVNRVIECWSMEGDTVLDPFGGLMTVPMCAIKKKRSAIGIELNPDYFKWGCAYLRDTEIEMNVPTLFDLGKTEKEVAA